MGSLLSYLVPNQEQLMAIIRWVFATVGAWVVSKGWVADAEMQIWLGTAMALAPLLWSIIAKTHNGLIASAASVPDAPAKLRDAMVNKAIS